MGEKKPVQYTVEREFLSKISIEEMLLRIIEAHLKKEENEGDRG